MALNKGKDFRNLESFAGTGVTDNDLQVERPVRLTKAGAQLKTVAVTTTGSAGSATGSGTINDAYGKIYAVELIYHASAPATTDVVIGTDYTAGGTYALSADTVLNNANSATTALFYPKIQHCDTTGTDIAGEYGLIPANGKIFVDVAGCDALTGAVTVNILLI